MDVLMPGTLSRDQTKRFLGEWISIIHFRLRGGDWQFMGSVESIQTLLALTSHRQRGAALLFGQSGDPW
jgi:hypothetical protein